MKTEENEILWGDQMVEMTVFFDNVRDIPEHRQLGKKCYVCGNQAQYAKLNERDEPLAYFCKADVYEARRSRKARLLLPCG
jgi:hypothetical protein